MLFIRIPLYQSAMYLRKYQFPEKLQPSIKNQGLHNGMGEAFLATGLTAEAESWDGT